MNQDQLNCKDDACEPSGTTAVADKEISQPDAIDKPKLIYFGDPMCSWCWGIAPALDRLVSEHQGELSYEVVLGGLRPGGGDEWTHEFRQMLHSHWMHVEEASDQPFEYAFFDREEFEYDTEPAARAVRVVRDIAPDKEWTFFKAMQRSFYAENKDPKELTLMQSVCQELSIDYTEFETLYLSEKYKQLVNQDFMKSQQFGIRGFPSVILYKNEGYYAITMGYSSYDKMSATLQEILDVEE